MHFIPREVDLLGIYFSPTLLTGILGVVAAVATAYLLNRYRLSRFFFFPPIVFLALAAIYSCLFGTILIPM